jgi:hypothetical protein
MRLWMLCASLALMAGCNECHGFSISGLGAPVTFSTLSLKLDGNDVSPRDTSELLLAPVTAGTPGFHMDLSRRVGVNCPSAVDLNTLRSAPLGSFCPGVLAVGELPPAAPGGTVQQVNFPFADDAATIAVVESSGNLPIDTTHLSGTTKEHLVITLDVPATTLMSADGHRLDIAVSQLRAEDTATYAPATFACPTGGVP